MSDFTTLFVLFYVAHKIGDYWVQTDWQASNKASNAYALWGHAFTYGVTFVPFLVVVAPAAWWVFAGFALVMLPHAWFDTRKPLNWYWVHVKHLSLDPASHPLFAVLRLEMDQAFHIACLALAAGILVGLR